MKIFLSIIKFSFNFSQINKNFLERTQKYSFHNSFFPKSNNSLFTTEKKGIHSIIKSKASPSSPFVTIKSMLLYKWSMMFMRSAKTKLKLKYPNKKFKMKTKQGLKKRIIIVGGLYTKGFKFKSPGARHKMINKTKANKR